MSMDKYVTRAVNLAMRTAKNVNPVGRAVKAATNAANRAIDFPVNFAVSVAKKAAKRVK